MIQHIKLVGTNHISEQSIQEIKQEFLSFQPDIIAVELDHQRLQSLLHPNQEGKIGLSAIRQFGVKGTLFLLLGRYAQRKLGKLVGIKPGSEMLFAANLARTNNLSLALVDRPINKTIKRLFKKLTWKEKFRFLGDILFAPFKKKQKIKFNISSVPGQDIITQLLTPVKKRYPTIFTVLVAERDMYMSRQLAILSKKNPNKKILVVVGAGHVSGMQKELPLQLQRIEVV
jgi:pheromone shutdown-related protein TraB